MTSFFQTSNKPLAPFIVLLALVILITIISLNLRQFIFSPVPPPKTDDSSFKFTHMFLSPFPQDTPKTGELQKTLSFRRQPPNLEHELSLAYAELGSKNLDSAGNRLRTLYVFYPEDPRVLSLLGNIAYSQGHFDQAELFYRKRLLISPNDPVVSNDLGISLAKQNKFEEAIFFAERVTQLDPQSHVAAFNLANLYAATGNAQKTLYYLRKVYALRGPQILPFLLSSRFDQFKNDREFQQFLREISLLQEQQKKHPGGTKQP